MNQMSIDKSPEGGDPLMLRLGFATRLELCRVCQHLKLDNDTIGRLDDQELRLLISKELRAAAGHSVMNIFRDEHQLPYRTILIDVADKLTVGIFNSSPFRYDGTETLAEIEAYIERQFLKRQMALIKKTKSGNLTDHELLAHARNAHLKQKFVADTLVMTGVGLGVRQLALGGLIGGPIAFGVTAALHVTAPNLAKVIPVVLELIQIQRSRMASSDLMD